MGSILTKYGVDADDHEGYVAQVLDDGSYSTDTTARMIGQVVAAGDCGWTGSTRYPAPGPLDEAAHELALGEWERDHAHPTLEGLRAEKWDRLRTLVRQLAQSHATTTRTRFRGLSPSEQHELLDRTLAALDRATTLARQLREPLQTTPGDAR